MSTRIVCDRCGHDADPPGRRSIVHLTELEFAASDPRHPAAENSYLPADLCGPCTDVIKAALDCALHVAQKFSADLEMADSGEFHAHLEIPMAPPLPERHPGYPHHHAEWSTPLRVPPFVPVPEETPLTQALPPDGPGHTAVIPVVDAPTEHIPVVRDNEGRG